MKRWGQEKFERLSGLRGEKMREASSSRLNGSAVLGGDERVPAASADLDVS